MPLNPLIRSSLLLKVNKEGTGEIILCPNFFKVSQIAFEDPAPIINWSAT